jgi:hypothetical protein
MLGYKIVREGYNQKFVIVEEEAKLVKQIFEMYATGHGTFQIAKAMEQLDKERAANPPENMDELCIPKWSCTSVLRILKNEKYVGDLLLGKTYTPDVLDHKKVMNTAVRLKTGSSAGVFIPSAVSVKKIVVNCNVREAVTHNNAAVLVRRYVKRCVKICGQSLCRNYRAVLINTLARNYRNNISL